MRLAGVHRLLPCVVAVVLVFLPGPDWAQGRQARDLPVLSGSAKHGVRTLWARGPREARRPASVQKLLLSMALFDELGPRHRIRTEVSARRVVRGRVVGDLWIVGGGDPSLSSADLQRLARRVRSAGVRVVPGSVRGDDSLFARDWWTRGWRSWTRSYVARPTALSLDGNAGGGDPAHRAASELTRALRARGVKVGEGPGSGAAPAAEVVAAHHSPFLRDLVASMNSASSNFAAEMLGKLLGSRGLRRPATIEDGARAVELWARRRGARIQAHDSSGLSYANRVTPEAVTALLRSVALEPWGGALRRSLPRPGEGTLSGRLAGVELRAKTGTLLTGESALAGWARLANGRWSEFALFSSSKSLEDELVRALVRRSPPLVARANTRAG